MTKRMLIALALLTALLLSACGGEDDAPLETAGTPDRIKVSTLPLLSFAPLFIAEEEGFYAEQGLEVEFVDLRRTQFGLPALVTGQLDVLAGALNSGTLNAIARTGNVRIVAGGSHIGYPGEGCTWFAVLARKDVLQNGNLRHAPDKLRLISPMDMVHGMVVDRLLADAGLSRDEVEIRFAQQPALPEAVASGAADVVITSEPWVTRTLDTGKAVMVAAGQDLVPGGQAGSIAYGRRLLEHEPDVGRRFMVANLKAVRQYNEGPTERNLDILERRLGQDRELLRRLCWSDLRNDGVLNVENVMDFQDWADKEGLLDHKLEPDEFWDPAFVEHANAVLRAEQVHAGGE